MDTRYIAAGAACSWKGGIVKAQRDGRNWDDLTDEFGIRWSMPEDAPYYMDITLHPLAKRDPGGPQGLSLAQRRRPEPLSPACASGR